MTHFQFGVGHSLKTEFGRGLSEKIGMTGFEPAASCSQSRRATKLRYIPMISIEIAYRLLLKTERFAA